MLVTGRWAPRRRVKLGGLGMPRTGFDWHTRSKLIGSEELAEALARCLMG